MEPILLCHKQKLVSNHQGHEKPYDPYDYAYGLQYKVYSSLYHNLNSLHISFLYYNVIIKRYNHKNDEGLVKYDLREEE